MTSDKRAFPVAIGSDLSYMLRHPEEGDVVMLGTTGMCVLDVGGIDNRGNGGWLHHTIRIRHEDGTMRRYFPTSFAYEDAAKQMIKDGGYFFRPNTPVSGPAKPGSLKRAG